jgi:hypothetical protein
MWNKLVDKLHSQTRTVICRLNIFVFFMPPRAFVSAVRGLRRCTSVARACLTSLDHPPRAQQQSQPPSEDIDGQTTQQTRGVPRPFVSTVRGLLRCTSVARACLTPLDHPPREHRPPQDDIACQTTQQTRGVPRPFVSTVRGQRRCTSVDRA